MWLFILASPVGSLSASRPIHCSALVSQGRVNYYWLMYRRRRLLSRTRHLYRQNYDIHDAPEKDGGLQVDQVSNQTMTNAFK